MKKRTFKADLHVHSRHSGRPSAWVLKKIGCGESYTDPLCLYEILKSRDMDFVTITDHNTIDGCMEIGHLDGTFISEEVTTYFPADNCKMHVLVYNITEGQHADIVRVRKNIFDLVNYLNAQGIVHALAHPMCSLNGVLQVRHFEQCLLLFKNFELNGARDHLQNTIMQRIAAGLTADRIAQLAADHDLSPCGDRPWDKCLIGGSDDHSSKYMGRSYTQVTEGASVETFVRAIGRCSATVKTYKATPKTMAHNIYSIMYQFYEDTFQIDRWIKDSRLSGFLKELLLHAPNGQVPKDAIHRSQKKWAFGFSRATRSARWLQSAKRVMFSDPRKKKAPSPALVGSSVSHQFLENAQRVLSEHCDKRSCQAYQGSPAPASGEDIWFEFVNDVSDRIVRQSADDILGKLTDADLFYLFTHVGSSGSLYMMLSPYFVAYSLFSRDRSRSIDCLKRFGHLSQDVGGSGRRIALFTDTFNQINGVATAIQCQMAAARKKDKPLTLITCDPEKQPGTHVKAFEPIGAYDLPEYPELKIYYPPFLRILSYCYRARFTHIHAETPGAMGLAALGAAKLLDLPFCGTYHTSLPQTVGSLTGDPDIESLFWKYIIWFYGQMDRIYVPSGSTAEELIEKGLPESKVVVHQAGVNISSFHPGKRNGYFSDRFRVADAKVKLLYVGRVSKEKNLEVLEVMIRRISRMRDDVHLIVVGEGPYMPTMQEGLQGLPTTFTGYLTGEELAQAYASSDIFVFPSTVDTMGIALLEAQASGLPVIVTDKAGPSENMIDGKTGFVVKADGDQTADGFIDKTLHLCENANLRRDMRQNARAYALNRSFENSFSTFWDNYP